MSLLGTQLPLLILIPGHPRMLGLDMFQNPPMLLRHSLFISNFPTPRRVSELVPMDGGSAIGEVHPHDKLLVIEVDTL
jgi:hypothetical protein